MKRAFVCPGGRKRGMLASLLKAGAWLNLSGEGSRDGSEPGALGGSIGAGTGRGPGEPSSFTRLVRTWLHRGEGGGAPCQPHHHAGLSHSAQAPQQPCAQAGLEGCQCLCRPGDKAKGALGLLWLFPERNSMCTEKFSAFFLSLTLFLSLFLSNPVSNFVFLSSFKFKKQQ